MGTTRVGGAALQRGADRRPGVSPGGRLALVLVAASGLVFPRASGAQEDPSREAAVHIARLHYEGGGDWYSNPSSMPNWMRGFQQRTGMATVFEEVQVRPSEEALFRYPIAYMNGHGNVNFSDEDVQALRRWLAAGGFLDFLAAFHMTFGQPPTFAGADEGDLNRPRIPTVNHTAGR